MSTNKLRQAILNQPDINLPTRGGLIVNTQFSEPFCVYGAYSDGTEESQTQKKITQCMKGNITIKEVQSAIDPFTAHLKRALCVHS